MATTIDNCSLCNKNRRKGNYKLVDNPCPLRDNAPCEPCREMEVLETQIAEAESVLSNLLRRHQEVRRAMNTNHNRLLQKLPSEILSHIFKFAVDVWFNDALHTKLVADPFANRKYSSENTFPTPLLLGSICQQWRRIAWKSPELWTSMIVDIVDIARQERYVPVIEWLLRSRSLTLTIYAFADDCHRSEDLMELKMLNVINFINDFSKRWGKLILAVPSPMMQLFDGRSGNPQCTFVSELNLEVIGSRRAISQTHGNFQIINSATPSPSVVGIAGFLPHNAHIYWNNVCTLSFRRIFFQSCMQTLKQIPRLEDLTLQWMSDSGEQLSDEELSVPTLVKLSFYSQNAYKINGKYLLQYFHFPNLKMFLFDGSKQYCSSLRELNSFLSTCSPGAKGAKNYYQNSFDAYI